jgi:hypothetical protein
MHSGLDEVQTELPSNEAITDLQLLLSVPN